MTSAHRRARPASLVCLAAALATPALGGETLTETAKLLPSNGTAGASFGTTVAIDGDVAVVGAPYHHGQGASSGAAYVYRIPSPGSTWIERARLLASDERAGHNFGYSVAISGDTIVVGAPDDEDDGSAGGAVYVFVEPPGGWAGTRTEDAELLASDAVPGHGLGRSVAIDGDVVAAGSFDGDQGDDAGAVYVFVEPAGGWTGQPTESAKLLASDGEEGDGLGSAVALSGSTLLASAPWDQPSGPLSGSAYVFLEPAGGWNGFVSESARLVPSDGGQNHLFGVSVDLGEDRAVVGAFLAGSGANRPGAAYLFERPAAGWSGTLAETTELLASDGATPDYFGSSVAVATDAIVVGAFGHADAAGGAYFFSRPAGGWPPFLNEEIKLQPSDSAPFDLFGGALAVSGSTIVVGAPDNDDDGEDSGSAYVFDRFVSFRDGFETGSTSRWSLASP